MATDEEEMFHGPDGWTSTVELLDVLDLDPALRDLLRPHLPSFRFVLDDLVTRTDQDLRARRAAVVGRLALLLLRHLREHRRDPESVLAFLRTVADLFNLIPGDDRVLCFWYILRVAKPEPLAVQSALRDVVAPRVLEDVMTAGEKIENEVAQRLFFRLIRSKFGRPAPAVESRVLAADLETIEAWTDRVWKATSIEEVLDSAPG